MLRTLTPNTHFTFAFQSSRLRMFVSASVNGTAQAVDTKSLYEVLRVKRDASQIEIKTAYRTLAKLYHPDATSRFLDCSMASPSTDGRDFLEIHNAYSTLSDPDARAVYDCNLNVNVRRRWNPAGLSASQSPAQRRFNPTRRWETDQCW